SVDTYLRFAEAVNRLDLKETELAGLPELQEEGAKRMTEGAVQGVAEEFEPDSPTVRNALKGVAAGAAAAGVAAAAKMLADRVTSDRGDQDRGDQNGAYARAERGPSPRRSRPHGLAQTGGGRS